MDREWNDSQPIYRQLRDRVVAMILDGILKEGDPLPSVRTVAAEYRVNPLTVLKGYQELVDEGLVETRRGRGMFINAGARELLLQGERQKLLGEEWPRIHDTIQRLGLKAEDLLDAAPASTPDQTEKEPKPCQSSKHAASAKRSDRPSHSTASICASKKASSWDSSVPTAPARPPRSTPSWASPRTRDSSRSSAAIPGPSAAASCR